MRTNHTCFFVAIILTVSGLSAQPQAARNQATESRGDLGVTPVSGESWLEHMHRSFGDTSMGKTGRIGPGPQEAESLPLVPMAAAYSSRARMVLHGSDLYRLNCQGCHGESGQGAPPEINSVINPVRATSVALVLGRMKAVGMEISYADAAKLAQQSRQALLDRLHKGGVSMPTFSHLNDAEVRSLMAYLRQLADIPGASRQQVGAAESRVRVGELIVKSTCHTCHSATGADPSPRELMDGAIPPLSTLTARKNQSEFIRKVTWGAPVLMGEPPMPGRGRMPVFYYLSEEEAADVYLYLALYPPSERPSPSTLVAASVAGPPSGNGPSSPGRALLVSRAALDEDPSAQTAEVAAAAFPWITPFVAIALAGGLYFTFREFRRLTLDSVDRPAIDLAVSTQCGKDAAAASLDPSSQLVFCNDTEATKR